MWRDRWWRMYDRDPIDTWVHGRIALLGDAAHPPLQYLAQGAIMAIEDGWVLAEHAAGQPAAPMAPSTGPPSWRPTRRSARSTAAGWSTTARAWGELWHLDGEERLQRNDVLRARAIDDYSFIDWLYGPTDVVPGQGSPAFATP